MSFFEDFSAKHEQLKKRIHSFRMPLSPTGQRIMKVVYFSIPLISGYYIMKAAKEESERNKKAFQLEKRPHVHSQEVKQQNEALQSLLDKVKEKNL
eukprot:gene2442-2675_t